MGHQNITLFISHAKEDETIALALKGFLENIFLNGDFFVSGSDLGGGEVWIEELRNRLDASTAIIVLVTPYSKENKWVYFEAGAGLAKRKTIPVVADGISFQTLPAPLNLLQGRSFDLQGLKSLACDISGLAGLREPVRFPGLDDALAIANDFTSQRRKESPTTYQTETPSPPALKPILSEDTDPDLEAELQNLRQRAHNTLATAILNNSAAFDVPEKEEMSALTIFNLYGIAEGVGLSPSIMFLNVEITGIPKISASKWEKKNTKASFEKIKEAIEKFEKKYDIR